MGSQQRTANMQSEAIKFQRSVLGTVFFAICALFGIVPATLLFIMMLVSFLFIPITTTLLALVSILMTVFLIVMIIVPIRKQPTRIAIGVVFAIGVLVQVIYIFAVVSDAGFSAKLFSALVVDSLLIIFYSIVAVAMFLPPTHPLSKLTPYYGVEEEQAAV